MSILAVGTCWRSPAGAAETKASRVDSLSPGATASARNVQALTRRSQSSGEIFRQPWRSKGAHC